MELENKKHEAFCNEYLIDLNITQSYMRVYPDSSNDAAQVSGKRLLGNDKVIERVAELMEERRERVRVTVDEVLEGIIEVRDRCMQVKPVLIRVNGKMEESGEYEFKEMAALKSLELLGKHVGMWQDKKASTEALETIEDFINKVNK